MQAEQVKKVDVYYIIPSEGTNATSVSVTEISNLASIIEAIKAKNKNFLGGVDDIKIRIKITEDFYSFISEKKNCITEEEEEDKLTVSSDVQAKVISDLQASFAASPEKKQEKKKRCLQVVILPATQQQQQVQISDQLFFGNIKKAFKEAIKEEAEEGSMLSFSRVSVGDYNKILSRYGITVDVYKDIIVGTSDCYGFTWSGSKEDAQSGPYKNWINEHLVHKQRGLFVKTTSSKGQYLKFKGQIGDVVITISNVEEAILQYACVILELKKQISGLEHHYQAICELLGAASVSNVAFSPILVLTDLNEEWKFYFFTERKKVKMVHIIGLMTATNLIRAICQYRVGKDVSNTGVGDLSTFSAEIKNNFHLAVPDYNPVVDITTSHNDEDCHMFELFTEEEKREIFRRDVHETYQHWMSIYS